MPSYDSQGRLKIVNAATGSGGGGGGGTGTIAIASGSGVIVTSSAAYINFEGTAVRSVVQSGSGV